MCVGIAENDERDLVWHTASSALSPWPGAALSRKLCRVVCRESWSMMLFVRGRWPCSSCALRAARSLWQRAHVVCRSALLAPLCARTARARLPPAHASSPSASSSASLRSSSEVSESHTSAHDSSTDRSKILMPFLHWHVSAAALCCGECRRKLHPASCAFWILGTIVPALSDGHKLPEADDTGIITTPQELDPLLYVPY